MLVLSRKESEKILFPTVRMTVEVLRIRGNSVRLGIEAPPEVPILRQEIADLKSVDFSSDGDAGQQLHRLVHAVRHRLDSAATDLNRLHQHLDATGDETAQELILRVFQNLRQLDKEADQAADSDARCVARALLVEADVNERNLLASYLRVRGIETTTAEDGRDALDFLSLHAPPDVILFDMELPRCNGRCLVRSIRTDAHLRKMKLFAVSSTNPRSQGVPTGPGGLDRWFPKPVDPEYLVSQIADELGIVAAAV